MWWSRPGWQLAPLIEDHKLAAHDDDVFRRCTHSHFCTYRVRGAETFCWSNDFFLAHEDEVHLCTKRNTTKIHPSKHDGGAPLSQIIARYFSDLLKFVRAAASTVMMRSSGPLPPSSGPLPPP